MKRALSGAALCLVASAASAETFSFVAIGDMPYTLPADYPRFERLIEAINSQAPAFTLHIGDTKSGSTPCSDENLIKVRDYFSTFEQPLIYTPGDNEWTDCHRKAAGSMDPLERLAKVRELHFTRPESLGRRPIPLERQADAMPEHKTFVENQRWSHAGVVFATIHVVGSNNGFERTKASVDEWFARDAANVAWIEDSFKQATGSDAPAVVVAFQADPGWGKKMADRGGEDGFRNVVAALSRNAEAFKKPVLLIQGDVHTLVLDQPLLAADDKTPLENVMRLQVMGANLVHGVDVKVDTASAGVFGFVPLIIRQNLKTAPAG